MTERNQSRHRSQGEDGFLLLGVLFLMLLVLLALSLAAPKIAESIRRDKEVETVHRGLQYAHAIQVFYAKTGRYPTSIDQLMKTNNQRFLRKRYLNPMTGKDDWRLIHLGEAKVPAMGLFGQTVQAGGITPTGASTGTGNGFGTPSTPGAAGSTGSAFGSSGSSFGSSGSAFGSSGGSTGSAFGNSGSSPSPIGGTDGSTPGGSTTGSPTGASGFGSSPAIGGTTTTGGTSSAFGSPGATFGGAPIVGVGLLSKSTSIKIYKKQTHYNQWEFVFDPTQNSLQATAGAATNLNGASNGTGVNGGSGSGVGGGLGGGNSGGFGSNNGTGFGGTPPSQVNPNSPGTSQ